MSQERVVDSAELARELGRLPDQVADLQREVMFETAVEVYELVRSKVPVRSGRLQKSIGGAKGRKGLDLAGDAAGPRPEKLQKPRLMQNLSSAARRPGDRGYSDLIELAQHPMQHAVDAGGRNVPGRLQKAFSSVFGGPE